MADVLSIEPPPGPLLGKEGGSLCPKLDTRRLTIVFAAFLSTLLAGPLVASAAEEVVESPLLRQTQAEADAKSSGCLTCHEGIEPMHASTQVTLGCVDCHGGNASVNRGSADQGSGEYDAAMHRAHVAPLHPEAWSDPGHPGRLRAGNPERSYTLLNRESPEFIRFVNPGDLRVAGETCGACHSAEVVKVQKSLMTTTALLWGGAAYNNGIVSVKRYIFGESYSRDGLPQKVNTVPPPSAAEMQRGVLPFLVPLPAFNVVQPPDPFRAFERGGRVDRSNVAEVGNPNLGPFVGEPGHPDMKLGARGLGTDLRINAGVLNIHKTRLNDPLLSFLGTNDHPGDFRSSGCTACHVVYANDAESTEAGPYAGFGHDGFYQGHDPTIRRDESGHPIQHRLTRSIPTSQCMVCHMHQPNSFLNTYLGYQMWDYETDGELLWPQQQRYPTADAATPFNTTDAAAMKASLLRNPEEAAVRGAWTDEAVLRSASRLPTKETKFADYHGHGWLFRAVYWQDRKGNLLDKGGKQIDWNDPDKLGKAVQLKDIHAEKGMHCVDCHFEQDAHGNGRIYGEYPNAIEIGCQDCHGNVYKRASLTTSGPAAPNGGTNLLNGITPFGARRFEWVGDKLMQRSMVQEGLEWEVSQVLDSIDPASPKYNPKARLAKTLLKDGKHWGALPDNPEQLAHSDSNMACFTCHTSWVTSCFGCHLPQQANWKKEAQHFEGGATRNWTSYNPQVLRHDIFMLARHSDAKDHKIAPARSSSALILSSVNSNRERVYMQQAPVSAEGYGSQAFNAHFAHTVRKTQTRECGDCHVSSENDNNAWMAQVLMLGTNFVNFIGRYAWVGEGEAGIEGIAVTEWDEPQAVIGSHLQHLAYPDNYARHVERGLELSEGYHHAASDALSLQVRGEYLYTANGADGLRVFDIANIDNKGFSERIVSAPVSPLGQRAYVKTKFATSVALPTNVPIDYGRRQDPANEEQAMNPLYRYAYVADRDEGLVVVDVDPLADGDPTNNFLERAATFNPDGILDGASYITVAGNHAYVLCRRGLVVVGLADPLHPTMVAELGSPALQQPRAVAVQFRYAFVTDARGLRVVDITDPEKPELVSEVDLPEAYDLYVARTYAYVAAGKHGLAIVDVERPTQPAVQQMFDAGGKLNDTRSVRIGATVGSVFAYVADGANGLRVLQLMAPGETAGSAGFSPLPAPRLIATYKTHGPALTLSKGLDRDRAVDESGNQVNVFGRLGSRPFTRPEMERLFERDGKLFTVSREPPAAASPFVRPQPLAATTVEAPVVQPAAPRQERLLPGRD
ncbi:MAG: hypothetical protein HY270_24160 [Deltaproteobacteria bacterium]|nr:hypothetical protein [Deltaproteobacteria bacterium]